VRRMNRVRLSLAIVVATTIGFVTGAEGVAVCIGLRHENVSTPNLQFFLSATPTGAFVQLTGQAVFAEPNTPGGSAIVYGVSGSAISTVDGFFVSLTGVGVDQLQTAFNGTFAIQLTGDPTKNRLTYGRRSVDGTSSTVITGQAEFIGCPSSVADGG
jgi:hypothetical protein